LASFQPRLATCSQPRAGTSVGRFALLPGTSTSFCVAVMIIPFMTALLACYYPRARADNHNWDFRPLSIRGRTDRYQEAAEGTSQRDRAGAQEAGAIARHDSRASGRREGYEKGDTDGRPYLGGRVEYAGSHATIGRFRGISSGLGGSD
jgi:hypothetical protein